MQIVPRHELPRLLNRAGLEAGSRKLGGSVFQLTVKERVPPPFIAGPHRKITYPDGRVEGPFPVADRPALSAFLADAFSESGVCEVLIVTEEPGALWLNNKAQAAHLQQAPDAQKVAKFLRGRGLTNRFQGGFRVLAPRFAAVIPLLCAHAYTGGADVLFVSLDPRFVLTALASRYFDLHFSACDSALIAALSQLAEDRALQPGSLFLPDLPDVPVMWE